MHWGRALASLIVAALIAAFLPLLGAASATAAPERRIAEKRATGLQRVAGHPASSDPRQQIQRADATVRYFDSGGVAIDANVWTRAPASSAPGTVTAVGVGVFEGNNCPIAYEAVGRVADDNHYWLWNSDLPQSTAWNCVVVMVRDRDNREIVHDAMVGRLTNHYVQPKLTVSRPQLLGKAKKQLQLVRGAAQNHSVVVKNTGKYRARNVVVVANGKGVQKVRRNAGTIEPGKSATVTIPLRLTSKAKTTKVRFKASGSGVAAARTVKVRAVKAPAKPAAGAWRSPDSSFTFTVKNGRITKFRGINLRMSCGGGVYGYVTYRNVTLAFPNVKTPQHGYIDAITKWRKGDAWYTATLRGRIVGKRMTQARFSYSTAGNCYVAEKFTARKR